MSKQSFKYQQQIGARMRELRLKAGHTSAEKLCYNTDISRVLYSNYEAGKGNVTWRNLVKIIDALGVTVKEFFSKGFE